MTFLLTIIMVLDGHMIERPLGQMVDKLSCEAAGVAMVQDQNRKQAFMDLLHDVIGEFLEATVCARPDFVVQSAPEHERAGRA